MAVAAVGAIVLLPFLFIRDIAPGLFPRTSALIDLARPLFFLLCVIAALVEFSRYLGELRADGAGGKGWDALAGDARLSEREREVAVHLAAGRPYKEIAASLFISLPTVKSHAYSIYGKTGCHNRTALAEQARRLGAESMARST